MSSFYRKLNRNQIKFYEILIENLNINNSQLKNMKKMISQTKEDTQLKQSQIDYTDVSTENSSQHSIDSSFQEKSSSNDYEEKKMIEEQQQTVSQDSKMEDETQQEEKQSKITFFKKSVEWLGRKYKRFKVKTETLYLAITYVIKYISLTNEIKHKYELLAAVCLLIAAKFNQIHFPSIKSILGSLDFFITKNQVLQAQQELLEVFGFQIGLQKNSYSIVHEFFKLQSQEKRKNAQKLLFLAISNPQTLEFGEYYLGLSIVYLLKPEALKENFSINRDKMKKVAFVVYNMYKQKKNILSKRQNQTC